MDSEKLVLAVIGGSGLYHMPDIEDAQEFDLDTPFGKPSAPINVGRLAGKRVAFLARHGIGHTISPSEVNYRANIFALKMLGAERVVSISACGSLREDYAPGSIVIPNQLFDFTRGPRKRSFFEDGLVAHIGSADPFCADLAGQVGQAAEAAGATVHHGGTLITVEGPRFSTKAESQLFRAWCMDIIGMTACPEAFLAREAELCYATMAHVTDYDVWHVTEETVSVEVVIRTLNQNTHIAQEAIRRLVDTLPPERDCDCGSALQDALITAREWIKPETRDRLALLVDKYLNR
jgi:5'-methylthioadenosine phosphorylase